MSNNKSGYIDFTKMSTHELDQFALMTIIRYGYGKTALFGIDYSNKDNHRYKGMELLDYNCGKCDKPCKTSKQKIYLVENFGFLFYCPACHSGTKQFGVFSNRC